MAVDFIVSIASKTGEYMVEPIGRLFGHLIYYNRNINDLKTKVGNLENIRAEVQGRVDAAERNGEVVLPNVQEWLTGVNTITQESKRFFSDEVKANQRCFSQFCPDLKSRYQVGRKAKKLTSDVDQLQRDGKLDRVSLPAPPPTIRSTSFEDLEVFPSRTSIFNGILEAVQDEKSSIIGVYGMAGVGKTTLMKELAKQAEELKLFGAVVMPVVSQTPNVRKIQGEISDKLGLSLGEETESGRAGRLCERIKNVNKILVILDDVWERVDLEQIGIPDGKVHKGCKIVLTSRDFGVCRQMNAHINFLIQGLNDTEAWNLFEKMAGDVVNLPDINPKAIEVCKECAGLPIAIVTVARALMCGNSKSIWCDALGQLKNSKPVTIQGMKEKVFYSLELSYNFLESEEYKSFFLLCCLFPEDYNIPIEYLVRYGMGLQLFDNVYEVHGARDRSHSLVVKLKARCLLLDGDNQQCIKVHDVVRDFGIHIASKDKHARWARIDAGLKESFNTFNDDDTISLMQNKIDQLPCGLVCPDLKLLFLHCYSNELEIPNTFFEGMKGLRVLHIDFMYRPTLVTLPPSIQSLKNLRTLLLENCVLGDISLIGELQKVEIVSFARSNLKEIPKDIEQLIHLRLLDLTHCDQELQIIRPGVLSRLECLYMIGCSFDIRRNASAELKLLPCLEDLQVQIPNISIYLENLHLENLRAFQISIGSSFTINDPSSYSKTLKLGEVKRMEGGVKILLKRVECLILEKIELENVLSDTIRKGFQNLKCLKVTRCQKSLSISKFKDLLQLQEIQIMGCRMEEIFVTEEATNMIVFPRLHTLYLLRMLKLVSFCSRNCGFEFPSLKKLKCSVCPNMKTFVGSEGNSGAVARAQPFFSDKVLLPTLEELSIFGPRRLEMLWHRKHLAESCSKLRDLSIRHCNSLEVVLEGEDSGENVVLHNLRSLELKVLKKLKSFYKGNLTLEMPSLQRVTIAGCPDMKTFSSGIVTTRKLNASGVGHRKMLWKGELNSICKVCINKCSLRI